MKKQQPPRYIVRMIERLAPQSKSEEILGDLDEMFTNDQRRGIENARWRYTINAMAFFFKGFMWRQKNQSQRNMMIASYFKMAGRSLMAYKATTAINIFGLVIGIATAMLIFSVVRFEKSFDTFHSRATETYRLIRADGAQRSDFRGGISFPVPAALAEEIPELDDVTSVQYFGGANVEIINKTDGATPSRFREESGFAFAASNFFTVFDYKGTDLKWISGTPANLEKPFSMVLTKTMATKYFGNQNAIGQSVRLQNKNDFTVTGIIEDFPSNSDFPFTVLVSYSSLPFINGENQMNDWFGVSDNHHTFITLRPGTSPAVVEGKIAKVHAAHTSKELSDMRHYVLMKLSDVHFQSKVATYTRRTISHETLLGLSAVAMFLLLTACINYVNLSTAQSSLRAKEIGLRKVLGSMPRQVMFQYFVETFIVVLLATLTALVICQVLLFHMQSLLNMPSRQINFPDASTLLTTFAIAGLLTLLAGFYPSLVLSRVSPVASMQSKFATGRVGGFSLRKVLVVAQFTLTQMMVVGTFIVAMQMKFFRDVDMGFDKDNVITVRIPKSNPGAQKVMEDKLRSQAFISDVSFSYTLPGGVRRPGSYDGIGRPGASALNDFQVYEYVSIDKSFIGLYKMKLVAGRNLTEADSSGNIIINEALTKSLALGTPNEALGQNLKMGGDRLVTVVGVVGDYYSNSMKEVPGNIVMTMEPRNYSIVSIKLHTPPDRAAMQKAVAYIDKVWSEAFPEFMFNYTFLDENIAAYYVQEDRYAKLFQLFSFVLLAIGSLGLYGLISFVVNRKGKEVAIRKVLGANVSQILSLFTREYALLIVLSFTLAVPVSFYAVSEWLANFQNHISLTWYLFVVPGLSVLILGVLVILSKSLRVASLNPVDMLKDDC